MGLNPDLFSAACGTTKIAPTHPSQRICLSLKKNDRSLCMVWVILFPNEFNETLVDFG